MNFPFFLNSITKLKEIPLPGQKAHLEMSSYERLNYLNSNINYEKNAKKASVLICVYANHQGNACFALMERPVNKDVHSGQICLPGGKKEAFDDSNWITSIRETQEELGLDAKKMKFIKALTSIYIPPSNFIVYPFISLYEKKPIFKIDKNEVEKVFDVPFKSLLNDISQIKIKISNNYMNENNVPAFKFNDNIVWGATAMILSEFKFLLKLIKI